MIFKEISDKELILSKLVYLISKFNVHYISREDIDRLCSELDLDKEAFLLKDPSIHQDSKYLLLSFSSFLGIIGYRLANLIYYKYKNLIDSRAISEYIKVKTGIEIHPGAKIGSRFVIDHGVGTVIGETCIIGESCYFLQQVILGSTKITHENNLNNSKRHPTIGNNVEIGGFVRIYGDITIGNNVKISPHAIIYSDVPDNHSVIVKNTEQYLKKANVLL